jgi:hypothetical protein
MEKIVQIQEKRKLQNNCKKIKITDFKALKKFLINKILKLILVIPILST